MQIRIEGGRVLFSINGDAHPVTVAFDATGLTPTEERIVWMFIAQSFQLEAIRRRLLGLTALQELQQHELLSAVDETVSNLRTMFPEAGLEATLVGLPGSRR